MNLGIVTSASADEQAQNLAQPLLITHKSNNNHQSVLRRSVRAMYSMRMQSWPDGSPLTVFVLADDHPIHREFCRDTLGILPFYLRRSWLRLVFSGKSQAPVVVSDINEMKRRVSRTPGAIGYISRKQIDASVAVINII